MLLAPNPTLPNPIVEVLNMAKNKSTGGVPKSQTSTYKIWQGMKKRCMNPSSNVFRHYGERGIRVCEEWRISYDAFLADMGERPSPQHSLDRINNEGNYEPSNCRWATRTEQNNNASRNLLFTINGHEKTLAQWCSMYERRYHLIYNRVIRDGWDLHEALRTPKLYFARQVKAELEGK